MGEISIKRVCSLSIAAILIASVFANPISFSPFYLGKIYADDPQIADPQVVNAQIHFASHATSNKIVSQTGSPGEDENSCPAQGTTTVSFDLYLLLASGGPDDIRLTLTSGTDGSSYPTTVPITSVQYYEEDGTNTGPSATDSVGPYDVGTANGNVPASGTTNPGQTSATNKHSHVIVTFTANGNQYYQLHGDDQTEHAISNFYYHYSAPNSETCSPPPTAQPTLTVYKVLHNGDTGSQNVETDFEITVTGTNVSPSTFNDDGSGTIVTLDAGYYSVEETGGPDLPQGYDTTYIGDCTGTMAPGDAKTCTVTNTAIAPKLTVVKDVENGDTGSTNTAADFQMIDNGNNIAQDTPTDTTVGDHAITETGPDLPQGYTTTYSDSCPDGSLTLSLGDDVTCTVTNTAIAPTLTIIKHTSGGDGTFHFTVTGDTSATPSITTSGGSGSVGPIPIKIATNSVNETPQAGWHLDSVSCTNGITPISNIGIATSLGNTIVCTFNNGNEFMTGGGTVSDTKYGKVTHGFQLHCDTATLPNNLEINWGAKGNKFHLVSLSTVACSDDPSIAPAPPVAGFDTMTGTGTGTFNGKSGATVSFTFTDAGEPGKNDKATITVKDAGNNVVLQVTGLKLQVGNQQAHG